MKATLLTTEEYNAYYDPYIKALGNVDLFQAFNETEKEFLNLINSFLKRSCIIPMELENGP